MHHQELFYSKTFWERYYWQVQDDFAYEMFDDHPIRFQLTEHDALLLDPGEDFAYISLIYQHKDEDELEIAWDDEAHFHPFVFRFSEYQTIVYQIAEKNNIEVWIAALLLRRFVGSDNAAEQQAIDEYEMDMRKKSGLFTEDEWNERFEERVLFDEVLDRKWAYRLPYGWVLEGEDAYSLRSPANDGFPFQQWNRLLTELGCFP
ncbi:hypothetical protein [Paenibacillus sp. NPDC058071]|uniref:hypothetical protein n=1 Tax=Paenibacillus sp. NPDC058071 TaxID=3346326 RepID=UPI0036DCB53D